MIIVAIDLRLIKEDVYSKADAGHPFWGIKEFNIVYEGEIK